MVGETITGTYTYEDADGDAEGSSTFRWIRGDGTPIEGATAQTYTLEVADEGAIITFEVTPVAATGIPITGTAVISSSTVPIEPKPGSAPTATDVTVTGGTSVGDSLEASYTFSDPDDDAEGVSTYRWLRDGNPIDGSTGATYLITSDDTGSVITFEVTPVSATGTPKQGTPVESNAIGPIEGPVSILGYSLPNTAEVLEIEAVNLKGQRIMRTIETRDFIEYLAAPHKAEKLGLPAGVYFIRAVREKNPPQ
jgi:hypothetical protein